MTASVVGLRPLLLAVVVGATACATPRQPSVPAPLPLPKRPTATDPGAPPPPSADGTGTTANPPRAGIVTPGQVAGTLSVTENGEPTAPLSLGDIRLGTRGHWVILHFAEGYCPTCDEDARNLDQIATVSHPQGALTIVVTVKDQNLWRQHTNPPVEVVEQEKLAEQYAGQTAVVDPQGRVELLTPSTPSAAQVQQVIGESTAHQPVQLDVDGGPAVAPGKGGTIAVTFTTAPGHHVMSHEPTRPEYFALRVDFRDKGPVHVGQPVYPGATRAVSAGDEVSVYSGKFVVTVPFSVDAGAPPGSYDLQGSVRYQACTDRVCLFPVDAHPKAVVSVR